MEFTDDRGKRVVYVNHCLLNQNARFPGAAARKQAFPELILALLNEGTSIEQLPCLERMRIGGVSRKTYFKLAPLLSKFNEKGLFAVTEPFLRAWWRLWFETLCKKEAGKVVDAIEDYIEQGYIVFGVIAVNDSPTCGVTKTVDFVDFIHRLTSAKDTEKLEMKPLIQEALIDGSGSFTGGIVRELKKRKINVKVIPFDPWTESPKDEVEKALGLLNLQ